MAWLSEMKKEEMLELQDYINGKIRNCSSLESAAQLYSSILYRRLSESVVLARIFVTLPFYELPEKNKEFVRNLAQSGGVLDKIKDSTLVLSLLGTSGVEPEWHNRHNSKGHIGIPLASADFIDAIPMMSRLLRQLGLNLDWIEEEDTKLVLKTMGRLSGVFFVQDPREERDKQGRLIIAAQDFVEKYDVKTVFGIGGGYLGSTIMFTSIIFSRERLERKHVQPFMLQANIFKTATLDIVDDEKIFDQGS